MKILKIEPGEAPQEMEIDRDLESMQNIVGGFIQAIYPFDEPVVLICNDEGKLLGLPYNRTLRDPESGRSYDIVSGTCFLCGAPQDGAHFTSLTPEQLAHYAAYYRHPELFLQTEHCVVVIKR